MNTSFPSLRIEGGLLSGEVIDKIAEASPNVPGQKPVDFGLESNRPLIDEIASSWNDARSYWALFQKSLERLKPDDPGTTFTRDRWMVPFFSILGYNLQPQRKAAGIEGASYFISHRGGMHEQAPPIHITGFRQSLDRRAESGVPRLAPHSLVQEYLNRSEELWGVVANGYTLRLLRDSRLIRRQAYIEFDLKEIMDGDRFADYALLYRLIHATRLPKGIEDADKCLLEQYHRTTVEQGGRVRDHLRDGVQRALIRFGNGFLHHTKNAVFRANVSQKKIEPFEYYQQLLRLIYRFLFLMVSEERGLISNNEHYRKHYSITRIRNLAGTAAAYNEFEDLWVSLRATFSLFTDESAGSLLEVPPLNGDLFEPVRTASLNPLSLSNRDLLRAMWDLSMYREKDKAPWRRINYAALDVEELGSVYESLLEFQPVFSESDGKPTFDLLSGTERKSTGSYYTPPELVNEIIQSALVPVIEDRLKKAKIPVEKEQQLLSLTVCDPACGSGHFLLAAARRIGRELAQVRTGDEEPSPEQMRLAVRDVITHCIYGVDKNTLAVDLCKVALWLEGHTASKPLTFLDHRIRCGDSLVGVFDLSVLKDGIPDDAFTAVTGDDKAVAREIKKQNKKEREHRHLGEFDVAINDLTSSRQQVNIIADDKLADIRKKRELFSAYQQEGTPWCKDKTACDLWTAAFFIGLTEENKRKKLIPTINTVREYLAGGVTADNPQVSVARQLMRQFRFFHWPLEFSEVFTNGGFDCVLGNPPFLKSQNISALLGENYRTYLTYTYSPLNGIVDLCAVFCRKYFELLREESRFGAITTNTISQGDTRQAGLSVIFKSNGRLSYVRQFIKWPNSANVEVNVINIYKGKNEIECSLDGEKVKFISTRFDQDNEIEPHCLKENSGIAFIGSYPLGEGFVLQPNEAENLIKINNRNSQVIFPFITGRDLNTTIEQRPIRWIINFFDWPLSKAELFPEILSIISERVKPEREKLKRIRSRQKWWIYGENRPGLYSAISELKRILVRAHISDQHIIAFLPSGWVYSQNLIVFAFEDNYHFSLLQSSIHEIWMKKFAGTLRTDITYNPSDCFITFPFPQKPKKEFITQSDSIGAEYHELRQKLMIIHNLGLTKIYNLFNNPHNDDENILVLRRLHSDMDYSILACYGWSDINLNHGFYRNERGQMRYTIDPTRQKEILRRLMDLNVKVWEIEKREEKIDE